MLFAYSTHVATSVNWHAYRCVCIYTKLEYILPLVAQSLTVLGTADAAAEVLNMFDSKEVQHMFGKLLHYPYHDPSRHLRSQP